MNMLAVKARGISQHRHIVFADRAIYQMHLAVGIERRGVKGRLRFPMIMFVRL
jgi:hypothetical protein